SEAVCRGFNSRRPLHYFVGLADFQLEGNRDLADDESAGNCFLSLPGRHRDRSDIQSPASAGASRRRGSPDEEKSLSFDGQPSADEVPGGAEIKTRTAGGLQPGRTQNARAPLRSKC